MLSVCLRFASQILENIEAIAIKFDTMTASVMKMYYISIILTLTFTQGHTRLNHENNKCSIISNTAQAMPIKFKSFDQRGLHISTIKQATQFSP